MELKDKKVTVVGLGRSGMVACELLLSKGAKVSVTDYLDNKTIRENIENLRSKSNNLVNIELGEHTESFIEDQDLLVTSPGVAGDCLPLIFARKKGIPVIAEIELAFSFCPAPVIAITGTNGKTTVSCLVGQILQEAGLKTSVCGNIGVPFSAEVENITDEDIVVLETSSFQLETIDTFKPRVAAVLNLTIDHLDRYSDFNQYLKAKARIFSNQNKDDWAVLNRDDASTPFLETKSKAKILYFSNSQDLLKSSPRLNLNHLAAITISSIFGVAQDLAVQSCLRFKAMEHRVEGLTEINGVRFINDSKATNVDATLWALNAVGQPVILIAGGRDKGSNFALIRETVKNKVKAMVLLGEAKEKIEKAYSDLVLTKQAETIDQAVKQAFKLASPGDCVLLSPMCASFDMFSDYRQRGRLFKQAVQELG